MAWQVQFGESPAGWPKRRQYQLPSDCFAQLGRSLHTKAYWACTVEPPSVPHSVSALEVVLLDAGLDLLALEICLAVVLDGAVEIGFVVHLVPGAMVDLNRRPDPRLTIHKP